jgi:hypothetical protein
MADRPQEVRRVLVLGNFRDPMARFRQRREKRAHRPGNSAVHRALIRRLPCCMVGCDTGAIVDPHHLKTGPAWPERAFGRRASDQHCVPLCRIHHEDLESWPSLCEPDWFWEEGAINCHPLARGLWTRSPSFDDMLDFLRWRMLEAAKTKWLREETAREMARRGA